MGCDELQVITSLIRLSVHYNVIFNRKEELSGSCLISSELANSYAVNPHEKHISRGLSVSKYLSSGWCYTQYSLCDGVSWYMRHRDLKAV